MGGGRGAGEWAKIVRNNSAREKMKCAEVVISYTHYKNNKRTHLICKIIIL